VLGLYPEGTRSLDRPMLPFLRGASWLAAKTGAPIVPCGIKGSERRPPGRPRIGKRVEVVFGPPIRVEPTADPMARLARSEEVTIRLRAAVAGLVS
jgi:1-acyl-sn-glycerol-3-phosphate acyltransferase